MCMCMRVCACVRLTFVCNDLNTLQRERAQRDGARREETEERERSRAVIYALKSNTDEIPRLSYKWTTPRQRPQLPAPSLLAFRSTWTISCYATHPHIRALVRARSDTYGRDAASNTTRPRPRKWACKRQSGQFFFGSLAPTSRRDVSCCSRLAIRNGVADDITCPLCARRVMCNFCMRSSEHKCGRPDKQYEYGELR